MCFFVFSFFFFSSRRRHTRCALVTGVQTCALPISPTHRFGGAETRGRNGGLVEAVLNIHRTCPSPSCSLAENGAHANRSLASQGIQTAVEVREPVADRVALIDRQQRLGALEID